MTKRTKKSKRPAWLAKTATAWRTTKAKPKKRTTRIQAYEAYDD